MQTRPDYRIGYTLNDQLEVTTEVRCYITDGKRLRLKDPLGVASLFIVGYHGSAWHSKDHFVKDEKHNLIRAR